MGVKIFPDNPMMKALLVLSVFIAQSFGQTAECNPPMPSECAEGEISCDNGSYADCWMGDFCMPEGSICPTSCNTPAASQCMDGEVNCDMGADASGCWMGDYCMAEGSVCPVACYPPLASECATTDIICDMVWMKMAAGWVIT